jgi:predicted metalloprotease
MRLDELPKSARIEDRRGVTVARGGIGIGTIVVLGLIGWALGIDPRLLIGGAEMMSRSGGPQQQVDAGSTTSSGSPSDTTGQFVAAVLGSTETVWTDIFAQAGRTYKPPTLVMFSGATQSGCAYKVGPMLLSTDNEPLVSLGRVGLPARCIPKESEPVPDQEDRHPDVKEHVDPRYGL